MKELEKELDDLMKEDKPDREDDDALAATLASLGIKDTGMQKYFFDLSWRDLTLFLCINFSLFKLFAFLSHVAFFMPGWYSCFKKICICHSCKLSLI